MDSVSPLRWEHLAKAELFFDLSPDELRDVAPMARVRRFAKGTVIFNQGDAAGRAHVLIEGSVRISQAGSDGNQAVMRFIVPGETFGTVALFTDGRYPAEACAITDMLEASWSAADLGSLLKRYPQITVNVVHVVGKRLQEAQNRVRELSTKRAEQRVAYALLRLAQQAGRSTPEGTEVAFPLRRKDIADISGTTLHTASRVLTSWERRGLVSGRNQRLTLRRAADILRIAERVPHANSTDTEG